MLKPLPSSNWHSFGSSRATVRDLSRSDAHQPSKPICCAGLLRRGGLSLLELLVVLTILIALGGIVVSTLPGILERTQVATAAANVPQIDSSIRQNWMLHQGRIGSRFDALVTGTSGLDGGVPKYIGGAQYFQTVSINSVELLALQRIGVNELVPATENAADATFESHQQQPVVLTADASLCAINNSDAASFAQRLWNLRLEPKSKLLVFGIGSQCSLVGSSKESLFAEAPVHFSDNQMTNPKNMYARYLIVIELTPDGESAANARYVGTCAPSPDGLRSISQILQRHYNEQL